MILIQFLIFELFGGVGNSTYALKTTLKVSILNQIITRNLSPVAMQNKLLNWVKMVQYLFQASRNFQN